jgi:glutathione synthase/RimK-type ligase-like ATP-grasp enzyme
MSIAILSNNISCESATALAEALKADYFNTQETEKLDFTKYDHVFKYGCSAKIKANKVFNNSIATSIAIDKIKTFQMLRNEGITIKWTLIKTKAREWLNEGYLVVARNKTKGANGDGLAYCETQEDLTKTPAIFWTRFLPHTNEFRVNCWRGKVLTIYDKVRTDEDLFSFKLWQGQENHPQLVEIAKKVYEKIGLDWCGIDILRTENGTLKVIEVNSAPVLYPITIKKLIHEINGAIKHA